MCKTIKEEKVMINTTLNDTKLRKLFNTKMNALAELRKAQDAIGKAHDYVAEYNTELDCNVAEELIDRDFLNDVFRTVQGINIYTQWICEEKGAMEQLSNRRAA